MDSGDLCISAQHGQKSSGGGAVCNNKPDWFPNQILHTFPSYDQITTFEKKKEKKWCRENCPSKSAGDRSQKNPTVCVSVISTDRDLNHHSPLYAHGPWKEIYCCWYFLVPFSYFQRWSSSSSVKRAWFMSNLFRTMIVPRYNQWEFHQWKSFSNACLWPKMSIIAIYIYF